jgi:hypothetical protein
VDLVGVLGQEQVALARQRISGTPSPVSAFLMKRPTPPLPW